MKLFRMAKERQAEQDNYSETYDLLKDNLARTTDELNTAYANLQNVVDPDLIDYYIYQTKAVQMRYKFLLECVKKIEDSYARNPL